MSIVIEQPRYTCALAAQQTVLAIPGAHPIIHAGPGCSEKARSFAGLGSGQQGEGYAGGNTVSCTNSSEAEVVFGGEKKLTDTIDGALRVLKGDLFVVLTGCTSDIVGDDSISVAKRFAKDGYPVVGTETAGFKGNNYYGHNHVVDAIIEQYVGDVTPQKVKGLVNVFSVVPFQNPYWRGDLEEIKSLLESIGLQVNILYGVESQGAREWKTIPNAEFNLLLSPWVGLKTVKLLERKYGTPFLHYPILPVGAQETSKFLRTVGEFANLDKDKIEQVILKEEKKFYDYFLSVVDFIGEYRSNLPVELYTVADSTYALGTTNFLVNELGLLPQAVYVTDNPPKNIRNSIIENFDQIGEEAEGRLIFAEDGGAIQQDIAEKIGNSKKTLILGSSWDKILAEEKSSVYVNLSLPLNETVILNKTFVGYSGGLQLIQDVYSNLFLKKSASSMLVL